MEYDVYDSEDDDFEEDMYMFGGGRFMHPMMGGFGGFGRRRKRVPDLPENATVEEVPDDTPVTQ